MRVPSVDIMILQDFLLDVVLMKLLLIISPFVLLFRLLQNISICHPLSIFHSVLLVSTRCSMSFFLHTCPKNICIPQHHLTSMFDHSVFPADRSNVGHVIQWHRSGQDGGQAREHHVHDAGQEEEGPFQRHDGGGGPTENAPRPPGDGARHHYRTLLYASFYNFLF